MVDIPLAEVVAMGNRAKREGVGDILDLCTISNAKSGRCAEDCRFCAQSSRHATSSPEYPLKQRSELLAEARKAKEIGSGRFCIVTSGNAISDSEIDSICAATEEIIGEVGIKVCGSLGRVSRNGLAKLKKAGMSRFHHNIETSPAYYPQVVSTHTMDDRIQTLRDAKEAGMQTCSGGIIGMGESWEDRIDMAFLLRDLGADSIPLNVLVPIPGTPMGNREPLSASDAIRTVAIFRIIMPDRTIKLAAGRESVLKDFQAMAYMAGANGMIIGGYLTIRGRSIEEDQKLIAELRHT